MSSRLDELNQLYSKELEQAADTPPAVIVLDSNWRALLELNKQLCGVQTEMLCILSELMTREDMEQYRQTLRSEQMQTVEQCREIGQTTAEQTAAAISSLTQQTAAIEQLAGSLSERSYSLLKEHAAQERRSRRKWLLTVLISQGCWMVLSAVLALLLR